MTEPLALISCFVLSIALGAAATFAVQGIAQRYGWVSFPTSHHIHKKGIPRLGGIAVFGTFVVLFALGALTGANPDWRELLPILFPAAMMFAVGLVDDLRGLSAKVKLFFQVCAAGWLFVAHGGGFQVLATGTHLLPNSLVPLASLIGTILWVVLITNAFNLIDGLDGLAAGATLFTLIALCGLALSDRNWGIVYVALALGGAVLGFLRYNFNPASIFLGDCGSLFLGFMLSGMALLPRHAAGATLEAVSVPLLAFGVPILEAGVSIIRRFLGNKSLFAPDRDHLHHRLLSLGLTHRQAVIVLYVVCAGFSLLSLIMQYSDHTLIGMILIVVGLLVVFGIQSLGYQEFCELSRLTQRWFEQKRVIANNIVIRKTSEMLKGCNAWEDASRSLDALLKMGEFDSYTLSVANEVTIRRTVRDGEIVEKTLLDELSEDGIGVPSEAMWFFTVDLPAREGRSIGSFKIGRAHAERAHAERAVMLNVNLLLSELQPALGELWDRVHARELRRPKIAMVYDASRKSVESLAVRHSAVLNDLLRSRSV